MRTIFGIARKRWNGKVRYGILKDWRQRNKVGNKVGNDVLNSLPKANFRILYTARYICTKERGFFCETLNNHRHVLSLKSFVFDFREKKRKKK